MGLFDKKIKKHDGIETGPVLKADDAEHVEASQPVVVPPPPPPPPAPVVVASVPPPVPVSVKAAPLENEHPDYGIAKAIQLMRMLPDDNMELIVCVVKTTLESTNVKVSTIINDATRKQSVIEGRIEVLAREIAGFEAEVAVRKREIATLEADYKETSTVKDWLMVAETLSGPKDASKSASKEVSPVVLQSAAAPTTAVADKK